MGATREMGAVVTTSVLRFGATGTGLTVGLGGVVARARGLALAGLGTIDLRADGRVLVAGAAEVFLRAFARAVGLVGAFFSGRVTDTATFFELPPGFSPAFLVPFTRDRVCAFDFAGARIAFVCSRGLPFFGAGDFGEAGATRLGTCLDALRRTTGTRLLMVSGLPARERRCRSLRANAVCVGTVGTDATLATIHWRWMKRNITDILSR